MLKVNHFNFVLLFISVDTWHQYPEYKFHSSKVSTLENKVSTPKISSQKHQVYCSKVSTPENKVSTPGVSSPNAKFTCSKVSIPENKVSTPEVSNQHETKGVDT